MGEAKMTKGDWIRSMSDADLARVIMCPNDAGLDDIDCNKSDACNCWACIKNWMSKEMTPLSPFFRENSYNYPPEMYRADKASATVYDPPITTIDPNSRFTEVLSNMVSEMARRIDGKPNDTQKDEELDHLMIALGRKLSKKLNKDIGYIMWCMMGADA